MLVFTKQFGVKQCERDGKKKNTLHLAMYYTECRIENCEALGIFVRNFRISLCRAELSRC